MHLALVAFEPGANTILLAGSTLAKIWTLIHSEGPVLPYLQWMVGLEYKVQRRYKKRTSCAGLDISFQYLMFSSPKVKSLTDGSS